MSTATTALDIRDVTPDLRVCIMDNGTIRILGNVTALSGVTARKLAYALMSAGAQI